MTCFFIYLHFCSERYSNDENICGISHGVGCGFVPQLGHTKDHHKYGTNCLSAGHAGITYKGRSLTVQPDLVKGRIVCVIVYGDKRYKDILGSMARVGYCIPVPDFYLVLRDL